MLTMLFEVGVLVMCSLTAQCATVKRNAHPNVPMSALESYLKSIGNSRQNPHEGYATPDDDFVAIYPTNTIKKGPNLDQGYGTVKRNAHPNVPMSALSSYFKSEENFRQNPYQGYATPDDNFVAIYPMNTIKKRTNLDQIHGTVKRNAHPNVPMSALSSYFKSEENSRQNPYQGYATPDDDFVAIYPMNTIKKRTNVHQIHGTVKRNAHPNVPMSALSSYFKSEENSQQNPYQGYATPDDNFVAIYPMNTINKRTNLDQIHGTVKRNAHPNVPMSALSSYFKSEENSRQSPYQGYATPDDDFIAISPPRRQNRGSEGDRDAGTNPDFSAYDFSKMNSLSTSDSGDISKMMENINRLSGGDLSGNHYDLSKMMENMNLTPDNNPAENPFDYSKMMENMNFTTDNNPAENPFDYSKMMENMNLTTDNRPSENPFDFSKMMENMNFTTEHSPSENPFDFSQLLANMNHTTLTNSGIDMSEALGVGLDEMLANLSKTVEQMKGLGMDTTNIDFMGNQHVISNEILGAEKKLVDRLENMEERLEDLEFDVDGLQKANIQVAAKGRPSDFLKNPETGSFYIVSEDRKSWTEALVTCVKEYGAYLVNIETAEENLFLKNALSEKYGEDHFYIGGRMKGKTFRWRHTNKKARFTNWGPGEPNRDLETKERCVEMGIFNKFIGYEWKVIPCFFNKRYICEKPL